MTWNVELGVLVPHRNSAPTPVCECMAKKLWESLHIFSSRKVWCCVSYFYSKYSRWHWREGHWMVLSWSKQNQQGSLPCFKHCTLWNALNDGAVTGTAVKLLRRMLWKGQHWLQGTCCCHGATSSPCELYSDQLWSRRQLLRTVIVFG